MDHDPHPWSKTPGKPPETSGNWLDVDIHKYPANMQFSGLVPVRLKIVVSPVRVWVWPFFYARAMLDPRAVRRLDEASRVARAAEASGEDAAAGEAWRRYRLIRDAARDPDELLAEGIALSRSAMELAAPSCTPR
jgi:hypothetical protein